MVRKLTDRCEIRGTSDDITLLTFLTVTARFFFMVLPIPAITLDSMRQGENPLPVSVTQRYIPFFEGSCWSEKFATLDNRHVCVTSPSALSFSFVPPWSTGTLLHFFMTARTKRRASLPNGFDPAPTKVCFTLNGTSCRVDAQCWWILVSARALWPRSQNDA